MRGLLKVVLPMVLVLGIVSADDARRRYTAISSGATQGSQSTKEDSGFFLGLEMGLAKHSLTLDTNIKELQGQSLNTRKDSISFAAYAVGGKFGYKHFFIKWVGLRGYINVDYVESVDNGLKVIGGKDAAKDLTGDSITNNIYYGANVDLLVNFWTGKSSSVGMFAGFGVGYQHIKDTLWLNMLAMAMLGTTGETAINFQKHRKLNGLYWDIKVGLRVNAATHHDVEFIAKFTPTAVKGHFSDDKNPTYANIKIPGEYKQSYQFMLGYNFVF